MEKCYNKSYGIRQNNENPTNGCCYIFEIKNTHLTFHKIRVSFKVFPILVKMYFLKPNQYLIILQKLNQGSTVPPPSPKMY